MAGRVKGFKCPKCGKDERFPRCNHPGKLLATTENFSPTLSNPFGTKELAGFFSVYEEKLYGTTAWRRMIGRAESRHKPYMFQPTNEEINNKRLRIQYSCASDKYFRGCKMDQAFLEGWKSGAATVNSVFRKCEYDWTTVCIYLLHCGVEESDLAMLQKGNAYLARLQGSPSGLVTWQFDFTSCDVVIDTVTIATRSYNRGWEGGRKLEGDEEIVQDLNFSSDQESLTSYSLSGYKSFKLTASLSGGNGHSAWQHSQLFSQPIDNKEEMCLDITVTLRDSQS